MPNLGPTELIIVLMCIAIPVVVIAAIVAIVLASRKNFATKMKMCPYCKSQIPADAVVCKYCTRAIEP
jgi:hypothetical protein